MLIVSTRHRLRLSDDKEDEEDRDRSLRKRKTVRFDNDDDDNEQYEEKGDRRRSLRKRTRIRYDDGKEDDDREEEEELDDEQPGPSTQYTNILRTPEKDKNFLPVTCGNKKGLLDAAKLARGEACIESEGRWFRPQVFEDFGGKGSSKKWKTSIHYENKPLQVLFENGVLTTPRFQKSGAAWRKQKKVLSSDESENSSEEPEEQSEENADSDDIEDKDYAINSGSTERTVDSEEEEEERTEDKPGNEDVDSVAEKNKEEEHDNEVIPTVANDKDNNSFKGSLVNLYKGTVENSGRKLKTIKICLERFLQDKTDHHSTEPPAAESWCEPLNEDVLSERGTIRHNKMQRGEEDNGLEKEDASITASKLTHSSQMLDPPITASGGEFEKQRDNNHGNHKHIRMSRSEVNGELSASGNITEEDGAFVTASTHADANVVSHSPVRVTTRSRKKESREETSIVPPQSLSLLPLIRLHKSTQTSDRLESSDPAEGPSSIRPSATGSDVDTMSLDELKREKIKMQLKVLQLQEEYYAIKLKKHKL